MLNRYGVEYVLCGHTHTTTDVRGGGLHVYTVGGTAKVEDNLEKGSGVFFRRVSIGARGARARGDDFIVSRAPRILGA
mgnify:CR=1 FL=1